MRATGRKKAGISCSRSYATTPSRRAMRSLPARDSPTTPSFRPPGRTSRSREPSSRKRTTSTGTRFTPCHVLSRSRTTATSAPITSHQTGRGTSRGGVRDHDFQILGTPLAALGLEVVHIRREELCQDAGPGDLERGQLFLG